MKIAFLHPDLGIGGAERLVVDAALGLQKRGHDVIIYTSHLDKSHCFDEVKSGPLRTEVLGDFLPTNINGRFSIVCSAIRQFYLIINLIRSNEKYDVFIIDQLSYGIPLIKEYLNDTRIMFYCHFPDQLLSSRTNPLKKLYRIPFDWYEEWTTNLSDVIVVNSKFTRKMFHQTFKGITRTPDVIYPCVDIDQKKDFENHPVHPLISNMKSPFFLSVNRFERKKDIDLALEAFSCLFEDFSLDKKAVKLVIAGGYDPRVTENVEYLNSLVSKAEKESFTIKIYQSDDISEMTSSSLDHVNVIFLPSVSTQLRSQLLAHAELLLYTPSFEHFGIVPLEAMLLGTPALATNTGGPLETVIDGETGWKRPRDSKEWAKVMQHVLIEMSPSDKKSMGQHSSERVMEHFSPQHMAIEFEEKINNSLKLRSRPQVHIKLFIYAILVMIIASSLAIWTII